MKRSPMKPSQKPMARKTALRARRDVATLTVKVEKAHPLSAASRKPARIFRSATYLDLVRSLPCVWCGAMGRTQAAHSNQQRFGKGRGIKASDASAMALCGPAPGWTGCHAEHDQGGKLTKAERNAYEYRNICMTIVPLILAGKLEGYDDVIATLPTEPGNEEANAVYLVSLIEQGQLRPKKGGK